MKRYVAWTLRLGLAGLFVYAGWIKAIDPAGFAEHVRAYHLIPPTADAAVALYLPWLEVIGGVALLFPRWRQASTVVLLALTCVFMMALGVSWLRGLNLTCGCFGQTDNGSFAWWIGRDVLIASGLGWLWWYQQTATDQGFSVAPTEEVSEIYIES